MAGLSKLKCFDLQEDLNPLDYPHIPVNDKLRGP